ncbi:hypothetical protein O3P69_001706 [Scylla paramamosain]|uniref:Thioredoxin domain-containing protein n=1 Tax=Scylla paramamosain TaxID=85552 RepID=A0AAW0V373_SCYPA
MSVTKVATEQEFTELLKKDGLLVAHFMADWAPQCGQMNDVITELGKQLELKDVRFCIVPAEDLSEVSLKYKIAAVPTFLLLRGGQVVERVEGANAADLTNKVKTQAAKASLVSCTPTASTPEQDLNTRLKKLINSSKCMLFMKGSPDAPRCGFSRTTIELLNKLEADYSSFDILSDEEVRQGLKTYSNWPTYPQSHSGLAFTSSVNCVLKHALVLICVAMKNRERECKAVLHNHNTDEQYCCLYYSYAHQMDKIVSLEGIKTMIFDVLLSISL